MEGVIVNEMAGLIFSNEGFILFLNIIEIILALVCMVLALNISLRVNGKIGNHLLSISFLFLTLGFIIRMLRETGVLNGSTIYEKLACMVFIILMVIYFAGINLEIDGIDGHRRGRQISK